MIQETYPSIIIVNNDSDYKWEAVEGIAAKVPVKTNKGGIAVSYQLIVKMKTVRHEGDFLVINSLGKDDREWEELRLNVKRISKKQIEDIGLQLLTKGDLWLYEEFGEGVFISEDVLHTIQEEAS